MKVLTVDGVVYLGELEEDKNKIIVKNSLCLGEVSVVTKDHLANYITSENIGKLAEDIVIRGAGASVSERPLDEDLKLELDILKLKMVQAKKLAPGELENRKFSELIGA